jgi:hypothetical protein
LAFAVIPWRRIQSISESFVSATKMWDSHSTKSLRKTHNKPLSFRKTTP